MASLYEIAGRYLDILESMEEDASVLDEIKGIGPTRRKALMRHFGDIQKIREADVETLRQVDGMDARSAEAVYAYFH